MKSFARWCSFANLILLGAGTKAGAAIPLITETTRPNLSGVQLQPLANAALRYFLLNPQGLHLVPEVVHLLHGEPQPLSQLLLSEIDTGLLLLLLLEDSVVLVYLRRRLLLLRTQSPQLDGDGVTLRRLLSPLLLEFLIDGPSSLSQESHLLIVDKCLDSTVFPLK